MKKTTLVLALGLAAAGSSMAAEANDFSRFSVAGAAGLNGSSVEAIHLSLAPAFWLNKHFALGADVSYSYLPLGPHARGGGHRAYWGLATLTATALPSHRLSPYLTLGYGLGRYTDSYSDTDPGRAGTLGAGLQWRLSPRASLFVESRFAMMGDIVAADGLHMELPVRFGLRLGF
jgi:hypothetical protein